MPRTTRTVEVVDVLAQETAQPVTVERPKPEHELTPEQRRIRDLEHQLAAERGRKDPDVEFENPAAGEDNILIHFTEDGITALGQIWVRGQQLEFTPGSPAYRDTCDRYGRSWLELANDESAQMRRWGKVMFRRGPWPGEDLRAAAKARYETLRSLNSPDATVGGPTEAELEKAAAAEAARGRAAPRLPLR